MSGRPASAHRRAIITLTTDFGLQDWYVAAMRGVVLEINPEAQIVDLSHQIPQGDIETAAFVLAQGRVTFPPDTIHVTVVDPGVGSQRKPIIARCDEHLYVGPDNGVFQRVFTHATHLKVFELTHLEYRRSTTSHTFHGRDIFAPAAAHCSLGVDLHQFGPSLEPETLAHPRGRQTCSSSATEGTIIYIDHYGNAITDIPGSFIEERSDWVGIVIEKHSAKIPIGKYYAQALPGNPIALVGSSSLLEISINGQSAATHYDLRVGDRCRILSRA